MRVAPIFALITSTRLLSLLPLLGTVLSPTVSVGQGTAADYERADQLRARYQGKVFRSRVDPVWDRDQPLAWYRIAFAPGKYEFVLVKADQGTRSLAFDHELMARNLGDLLGRNFDADDLPLKDLKFGPDGKLMSFRCLEHLFERSVDDSWRRVDAGDDRGRSRASRGQDALRNRRSQRSGSDSPNGQWKVSVRNHNVWLTETESKIETQLSFEGNEVDGYVDQVYWAPNSSRFIVNRRIDEQEHQVHWVESSPADQLQPKLQSSQYLKPGDQVAIVKPQLFEVASKSRIPVKNDLFSNPYHLREYEWNPNSHEFYFVYNERGHQVLRVLGVDGYTGSVRAVVEETSSTFIDYAYKQYRYFLHETHELIWMSERDGWNHLYLYDVSSGKPKNQITQGNWVVRRVDHVDPESRQIWFQASGVYPNQDPYYLHACRVNFDGSGFVRLTDGDGTHKIQYSPNREYLIVTYSRVDRAPITELRNGSNGALIRVLEKSDLKNLREQGWRTPERFVAKGRDGKTDIHGVIYRPSQFSEAQEYPVIEHIYAGPHGSHVPKDFRSYRSSQAMAELGFVVVRIDGMGTSNRSKAFHDVCWQNLKDAGFPDRIRWMQAMAQRYPNMDLSRVGIYGGSAGGQNTVSALLHFGDFYKVGVADCGCHDNRMDKIWWNELWMGWPLGPHYEDNSNTTHAAKLEGKLFLTVAELDKNVDPASTMQLVDALVKADKDFDFMMIPGAGHGVGDGLPYLIRKRQDFFVRHLHGVEPREVQLSTSIPEDVKSAFNLDSFYQQFVDNEGFPIIASSAVSPYALAEADYLISKMLAGRADIRDALIDLNFRFSIMAYDEFTTDIPEHSDLTPARFWDRRARGLGATKSRPSVSCGEENLLQFEGDPYNGESILIHEFAHAIHEALRVIDPEFDERLEAVYQQAMQEELWKGKYAATNRYEYWAECVQSFFDDNRENDRSHNYVNTRDELREYDRRIHDLIAAEFKDNPWRYVPPTERTDKLHLAGFDAKDTPRFQWPEHLVRALEKSRAKGPERGVEIVEREIEGFHVAVDIQLIEGFDEELGRKALALLEHQLFGIKLLVSPERLNELQTLGIRIDRDNKTLKGIQYHPSERWLVENGHDARLGKMVHIPQAAAFVSRGLSAVQPRVILHELAHAYHDQFLGFDSRDIKEAYQKAVDAGRYEEVLHLRGRKVRHYALTDHKEYFAEGTEAYFGANDFYPYVRSELKDHDPELYKILEQIWGRL